MQRKGSITKQSYWYDGFRLVILNFIVATFCAASFFGTLFLVTAVQLPFPYPLLFILYIVLCLGSWVWFGRRLAHNSRHRLYTALIGGIPFWGVTLLGYFVTVSMVFLHDVMSFFVGGLLSTLVLCAGLTSIGIVVIVGKSRQKSQLVAP